MSINKEENDIVLPYTMTFEVRHDDDWTFISWFTNYKKALACATQYTLDYKIKCTIGVSHITKNQTLAERIANDEDLNGNSYSRQYFEKT